MSSKLAAIFRPGVLPADSGDCPRDRLVCGESVDQLTTSVYKGRRWLTEGEYRQLLRRRVRMIVLEER